MNRNMFFCLVLVACSSRAVTLEDLPFETVVETAGEATPKLVSYGKAAEMVANDAAYPVATNALALAEGALQAEADTLATVTARGATTTKAVTIGSRGAGAVGVSSFANGEYVVASGSYSHAEGGDTTASGEASHAEGGGTTASAQASHAEGFSTTASGDISHAEGSGTTASGAASHAEGGHTTASGNTSHASGFMSVASHEASFAWQGSDGRYTESPYGSHGNGTYNINPVGGLAGLWIGETPLSATLSGYATTGAVAAVQAEVAAKTSAVQVTNIVNDIGGGAGEFSIDIPLERWRTTGASVPNLAIVTNQLYGLSVAKNTDLRAPIATLDPAWQAWAGVVLETRWINASMVAGDATIRMRVDTLSSNMTTVGGSNTGITVPVVAKAFKTYRHTVTNATDMGYCTIQLYRSDDLGVPLYLISARVIPFK